MYSDEHEEEYIYNNQHRPNETPRSPSSSSSYPSYYQQHQNQIRQTSDFKPMYSNTIVHIILVNCTAKTNLSEKALWEMLFISLRSKLENQFLFKNVFIHITDEKFGLYKLCLSKLFKFKNVAVHKLQKRFSNIIDNIRSRNEIMVREVAEMRDNNPENVFPLIIGFNSEKNIKAIENFRQLSHQYNIKMIEKTKDQSFNDHDFDKPYYETPSRKRTQREYDHYDNIHRDSHSEDHHQQDHLKSSSSAYSREPQRYSTPTQAHHSDMTPISPRTKEQRTIETQEQSESYNDLYTDRDLIETDDPNDIMIDLKRIRKIPEAFADYEYYPDGSIYAISAKLIFYNPKYPDYQGSTSNSC